MQLDSAWKARIERDVCVIEDMLIASGGQPLDEGMRRVLCHQLERLVRDVIILAQMEERQKPPSQK